MIRTRSGLFASEVWASLGLAADSSGNPCVWRNWYACDCLDGGRSEWSMEWSCQCDDKCPECGCAVSPYQGEWIGPSGAVAQAFWEALPEAGA